LIKCPECGKDISDKAEFCPNCGYKRIGHIRGNEILGSQTEKIVTQHTSYGTASLVLGIISIVIGIFTGIIGIVLSILAIIFGAIARGKGDKYGTYGLILGIVALVLTIIIWIITIFWAISLLSTYY